MNKLILIQNELKAPKSQTNHFGKYKYRNQEDILEAVKPLLLKHGCTLTIKDRLLTVNNIMYIEAICTFSDGEDFLVKVKAQAGIDPTTKGMHLAQCFGASSSYARKYALNGLFLIDDTKDADATNNHQSAPKQATAAKMETITTVADSEHISQILEHLKKCDNKDDLVLLWDSLNDTEQKQLKAIFSKKKLELS